MSDFSNEEVSPYLLNPKFRHRYKQYFLQTFLVFVAIATILPFVKSLSSAAIAAGLGSSVVSIFINPNGTTARLRAMVGGHTMALLLGSVFSFILFAGSIETFTVDHNQFHALIMALSVGLLFLVMTIADTDHPSAGGIAIGMAIRE